MPKVAPPRPQILVTRDHDPHAWSQADGETEIESWFAVAQDLWGAGYFAPGQAAQLRRSANAVTIKQGHTVAVIGGALGTLTDIAEERGAAIDVYDCVPFSLALAQNSTTADVRGKLAFRSWNPDGVKLPTRRYDSFIALRGSSHVAEPSRLCQAIAGSIRPGGLLFVDEIYAADPAVAALVAHTVALPERKQFLHAYTTVTQHLQACGLELRSTLTATDQLLAVIKAGLARSDDLAQRLESIPLAFRQQRIATLRDQVQRTQALYEALERGLATAIRTLHRKATTA